jgi:hypothetical protein
MGTRRLAEIKRGWYIAGVKWLTKQEVKVVCVVVGLLATGWLVKEYRAMHPPPHSVSKASP